MPETPPDPDLSSILARIEDRLEGIAARLERMEDKQGRILESQKTVVDAIPEISLAVSNVKVIEQRRQHKENLRYSINRFNQGK